MDNIAIESFIAHCDDMMIAEEGFGDKARKAGKWILEKLNTLWANFMKFVNMVKNKVKSALRKMSGAENEEAKLKEKIASLEKAKKELEREVKVAHEERDSTYSINKRLSQLNEEAINKSKKLKHDMNELIDENKSTKENLENVTEELKWSKRRLDLYIESYDALEKIDTYVHNVLSPYWQTSAKQINDGLNKCREALSILKNIPVDKDANAVNDIMKTNRVCPYVGGIFAVYEYEKEHNGEGYLTTFKELIKSAKYSPEGRIQNTFVLKQIELFDKHIKRLESIKKSAESFVKEGDRIPNIYARDKFMLYMGENIKMLQDRIHDATSYMKDLMSLLNDPDAVDW